jgi:hypothetical protein
MDDNDENTIDIMLIAILSTVEKYSNKQLLYSNSLRGCAYVKELLTCQHEQRIYRVLRISLKSFYTLRDWCLEHMNLKGSRTQDVIVKEKLVMFLWTVN